MIFRDREAAAQLLAKRLSAYKDEKPLVLGLPRGGIPMAKIIAQALNGVLDVLLVRKLRHPAQPELAIGAIDESGYSIYSGFAEPVEANYLEAEKQRQLELIRRRRGLYTPGKTSVNPAGCTVIVVDDGIATGATMLVALRAIRVRGPSRLIAAVAVASSAAARVVSLEADDLVSLEVSARFNAVGQFFADFSEISDEEVIAALRGDA